jgi:ADP-ribosyltransferase exoenzyme
MDLAVRARAAMALLDIAAMGFNPGQRRGPDGRWIKMGGKGSAGKTGPAPGRARRTPSKPAPSAAGADRLAGAVKERDAWDAAPGTPDYASKAANTYSGDYYNEINGWLRSPTKKNRYGDKLDDYPGMQGDIATLTKAVGESPLSQDTAVWRGIGSLEGAFPGMDLSGPLDGMEWVDDGFSSTTARRESTDYFAGPEFHDSARLRVLLPAGTGAMRLNGWDDEAELLVGPKTRFRVLRDNGTKDGVRELDVEVLL